METATKCEAVIMGYCDDVIGGVVPACKWLRLAVDRFLFDLDRQNTKNFPYIFDWSVAQATVDWYLALQHVKGPQTGQPIELEPWQQFIEANIYAWKRTSDGLRRFRSSYEEVARKQGKSTRLSGAALRGLLEGGGAEVYAAATSLKQSNIVFSDAKTMARRSPIMNGRLTLHHNAILDEEANARFMPLSGLPEDGSNPSLAIVDELHEHKSRDLWDSLAQGQGARSQPLMRAITTAGFQRDGSICLEQRKYTTDVLDGTINDDTHFGVIYCLDDDDDWKDETVWAKANPNLNISVPIEELRLQCKRAQASASAQNTFRCKRLNEWTEQAVRWLNLEKWDQCVSDFDPGDLLGAKCFAGLDLASTTDITALVLFFPEHRRVLPFFWVPEEMPQRTDKANKDAMTNWIADGYVRATEGNETDYQTLCEHIQAICADYQCDGIAFDPWNAAAVSQKLNDAGAHTVKFNQSIATYSEPSKKFEAMVSGQNIGLPDNPVLRWMAANVSVKTDASGNIRPVKPDHKSTLKIDGIVALIMAIGLWQRMENETQIETSPLREL